MSNKDKFIDNEFATMWIENGILFVTCKPHIDCNLKIAKQLNELRLRLCDQKYFPTITDISKMKSIDKEARDYLSSKEGTDNLIACGVIFGNPLTKHIGNFFIRVNKPVIPVKLFSNKKDALKWLAQFKEL